jgi:hypothetical protein
VREATQYGGEEDKLDSVTLIRVVAGVLAVVVLFIIVWRRKRKLSA